MSEADEKLFRERLPDFTDFQAHANMVEYGKVVSLSGRPPTLGDIFAVKFAMDREGVTLDPIILNSVSVRALCNLLLEHGYGPPADAKR